MNKKSGHWQNTGLSKWISDNLYQYNTSDEKSMNPMKWHSIQNGGNLNDTRESINGFPCRLILINDGETPLNEGQNEPTPGNVKDMGIFNFNNDKGNTDTFGLDNSIFPRCVSYEVVANSDTSAGAFVPYDNTITNYTVTVLDYSGNEYRSARIPISFFNNKITSYSGNTLIWLIDSNGNETQINVFNSELPIDLSSYKYVRLYFYGIEENIINGKTITKGKIVSIDSTLVDTPIGDSDKTELAYLQDSFELRYPDDKEVGADYGMLGMDIDSSGTLNSEYGLKRVIDWVGNATNEEFVANFEQYFNKEYTFRYYLLVIALG